MQLDQIVVTSAARDGAKFAFAIEGFENDAGVIGQAANDLVIHFDELAQAARGQILENRLQFGRGFARLDERS